MIRQAIGAFAATLLAGVLGLFLLSDAASANHMTGQCSTGGYANQHWQNNTITFNTAGHMACSPAPGSGGLPADILTVRADYEQYNWRGFPNNLGWQPRGTFDYTGCYNCTFMSTDSKATFVSLPTYSGLVCMRGVIYGFNWQHLEQASSIIHQRHTTSTICR